MKCFFRMEQFRTYRKSKSHPGVTYAENKLYFYFKDIFGSVRNLNFTFFSIVSRTVFPMVNFATNILLLKEPLEALIIQL